jgi:probable DNA metabolism protein
MILLYDDTFEGFLSVIFECYRRKIMPKRILPEKNFQETLFVYKESVPTDPVHADRVWQGLIKRLSPSTRYVPLSAFLSGDLDIEMALFRFVRLAFTMDKPIGDNFSDPDVLMVRNASRKVMREAHRMVQFVRFQLTRDNIYFAAISPEYDVLPIIMQHFRDRFADQNWLVYDLKRDYGYYFNTADVEEVSLSEKVFNVADGSVRSDMLEEGESVYQTMWNDYCSSITIRERLNLRLQKQHMPRRYWKFLPEKSGRNKEL